MAPKGKTSKERPGVGEVKEKAVNPCSRLTTKPLIPFCLPTALILALNHRLSPAQLILLLLTSQISQSKFLFSQILRI